MPLIVENGTGVANANSYASVEQADDRLSARGNTSWADLDETEQKIPALIQATDYLTLQYRLRWAGFKVRADQSLDWPRDQVPQVDAPQAYGTYPVCYQTIIVPAEVETAPIDLALRVANGETLTEDLGPPVIEETVGPI